MPSFSEFLYICAYFGITPMAFFNEENPLPMLVLIGRLGGEQ